MTGWMFVSLLLTGLVCFFGGVGFGAQWVRDDMAAQASRPRPGWLPLWFQGPARREDA